MMALLQSLWGDFTEQFKYWAIASQNSFHIFLNHSCHLDIIFPQIHWVTLCITYWIIGIDALSKLSLWWEKMLLANTTATLITAWYFNNPFHFIFLCLDFKLSCMFAFQILANTNNCGSSKDIPLFSLIFMCTY